MAIICLHKLTILPLTLLLVCLAFSVCEGERCEALCSIESLRDQCERCRLRIPMRFGKRSSPPEAEALLDFVALSSPQSDGDLKSLANAGDLSSEFLQFLSNSLRNFPPSNLLNQEADAELRRDNARLNWMKSRLPLSLVRRKRTPYPQKKSSPTGGRTTPPRSPYYLRRPLPSGSAKRFIPSTTVSRPTTI